MTLEQRMSPVNQQPHSTQQTHSPGKYNNKSDMNLSPGGTKRGQQIQGNFSNSSLKAINKGYQPIMSHAVIQGTEMDKTRLSPYL